MILVFLAHAEPSPEALAPEDEAPAVVEVPDVPEGARVRIPVTTRAEEADEEPPRVVTRRRTPTEKWIRSKVPDHLEESGPLRIEWWQWIAMPVILIVSAGFGQIARRLTARTFGHVVRATPGVWDDALLARSRRPLDVAWGMGATSILASFLYLREPANAWLAEGLHVGLLLALLWFATRAADIAGEAAIQRARGAGNVGTASVLPLIVRASKIGLVTLGLVTVLSTMGYPVASLLAGLGIGGLALALAAQKTAENVFGSVSIGIDQPFRVGDLVKIEDFVGVVERIGLRSTSIRTPERTLITWPNGKLAELRVENYAARDRFRFLSTFALALDTPRERMLAATTAVEARLHGEANVWPSDATARITRVTPVAIELEVAAWIVCTPDAFALAKQMLLLDILAILHEQEAHLARPPEPPRA